MDHVSLHKDDFTHVFLSISTLCLALILGSPLSPFSSYSFDESETEDMDYLPAVSEHQVREG